MIDTYGLPMKFEFYWENSSGKRYYYELDFNHCNEEGWPQLTDLPSPSAGKSHRAGYASHPRPAIDYAMFIRDGVWFITQVFEAEPCCINVEDLL